MTETVDVMHAASASASARDDSMNGEKIFLMSFFLFSFVRGGFSPRVGGDGKTK